MIPPSTSPRRKGRPWTLCAFFLSCLISSAGHGATLKVESDKTLVEPGEVVPVRLVLQTSSEALGAYDWDLSFDPSLLRLEGIGSAPLSEFRVRLFVNEASFPEGAGRHLSFNSESTTTPKGVVILATATFRTVGPSGSVASITIRPRDLFNTAADPISPLEIVPFSVRIKDLRPPSVFLASPREGGNLFVDRAFPRRILSDASRGLLYVLTAAKPGTAATLVFLRARDHFVLKTLSVSGDPTSLALDLAGNRLFVLDADSSRPKLLTVNLDSQEIRDFLDLAGLFGFPSGFAPQEIAWDFSSGLLWLFSSTDERIVILDPAARLIRRTIPAGGNIRHLVVEPSLRKTFTTVGTASAGAGELLTINADTFQVERRTALPDPQGIALDLGRRLLFVSNGSGAADIPRSDSIRIFSMDSSGLPGVSFVREISDPQALENPGALVFSSATSRLYAVNRRADPNAANTLAIFGQPSTEPADIQKMRALAMLPGSDLSDNLFGLHLAFGLPRLERIALGILNTTQTASRIYYGDPVQGDLHFLEDSSELVTPLARPRALFEAKDNLDPSPLVSASLKRHEGAQVGQTISGVINGQEFDVLSQLPTGFWHLEVTAKDNSGNISVIPSGLFEVIQDIQPPRTTLSAGTPNFSSEQAGVLDSTPSAGAIFATSQTPLSFSVVDDLLVVGDEQGLGVKNTFFGIDAPAGQVFTGPFTISSEGLRQVRFFSVDVVGNKEVEKSTQVAIDNTPPVSSITVGSPSFDQSLLHPTEPRTLVSARTLFTLASQDPLSGSPPVSVGVKEVRFRRDNQNPAEPTTIISGPSASFGFGADASRNLPALPDGVKTVEFFSLDRLENTETPKTLQVELDATAPSEALVSPSPDNTGVCRVVKGVIPVVGSVSDSHIFSWTLSAAPGFEATTGFTLISSQAFPTVSQGTNLTLANWDTSSFSGFVTLRLIASDLVENTSTTTATVFVGDPVVVLTFGKKDDDDDAEEGITVIPADINKPVAVSASSDGSRIWVANRNKDRIDLFDAAGKLLRSFTEAAGEKFNKPSGVLLDEAETAPDGSRGVLYVSDGNEDRVLKLSASDGSLIWQASGKNKKGESQSGKGPGEFNKPQHLALFSGELYVADRNNGRIQVLSSSDGSFLRELALPAAPEDDDDDEDEEDDADDGDDDGSSDKAKPVGVALTSNGDLFVSDEKSDRVLKLDRITGALISVIAQDAPGPARVKEPAGLSVNGKDHLYVADAEGHRILKFSPFGDLLLAFGQEDDDLPLFMEKPFGLSSDSSGRLYLADRNADRVQVFDAPASPASASSSSAGGSSGSSSGGSSSGSPSLAGRFSSGPSADPVFKERAVFIYPNPARAGRNPTIHAEVGLADRVEFRIYSLAGEFIAGTELPGSQAKILLNPDTGEYQYSYEWTWRAEGVASGVYIALVRAHKEGEKPIKVLKKVAILR